MLLFVTTELLEDAFVTHGKGRGGELSSRASRPGDGVVPAVTQPSRAAPTLSLTPVRRALGCHPDLGWD